MHLGHGEEVVTEALQRARHESFEENQTVFLIGRLKITSIWSFQVCCR